MDTKQNLLDSWTEEYRVSIEDWYRDRVIGHYFGGDHFKAHFVLNLFTTIGWYWLLGSVYTLFDTTSLGRYVRKYKVQDKTLVKWRTMVKLFRQLLINQATTVVLGVVAFKLKHTYTECQMTFPTLSRFVLEWITFVLVRETLFYYSHRLIHQPTLYKWIHKKHHEWTAPIAITAMYCHPIENIVANVLPVVLGPVVMNSHDLVSYIWQMHVIAETLNAHSGYHFPFFSSSRFHDFHHDKFNANFGINGLLDWLHGTDKLFRQSKTFAKHKRYYSLNPPKDKKKNM